MYVFEMLLTFMMIMCCDSLTFHCYNQVDFSLAHTTELRHGDYEHVYRSI